ncbi:MAG: GtrA family protein [Bacteroidales bacterium]|nr:GtrA family protein [Bacteroidales bacterium]
MKEHNRVIRFALVGTLNFLIMLLTVWVMQYCLGVDYRHGNVVAYVLAQINNFLFSKYWVFQGLQKKESSISRLTREILLFLIAFGCAYGLQFLCLLWMVECMGLNSYLAQFLGLFVYGFVNYVMNRNLTFAQPK